MVRLAGRRTRERFSAKSYWAAEYLPYRLAVDLGVSPPTVNDIVREQRGITPEIAIRLAKYFGNSEQLRLNLQDVFAVYHARKKYSKELKAIKALAAGAATR